MYKNKKRVDKPGHRAHTDMDFRQTLKDVENFSHSHMTWKESKTIENQKVVSLGGKDSKHQRLPLSMARPKMKKQKEREQKMLKECLILGEFGGKLGHSRKRSVEKQKDGGLKSSEGRFINGVLDVRHLLKSAPSRHHGSGIHVSSEGKKKSSKIKRGKKGCIKKHH